MTKSSSVISGGLRASHARRCVTWCVVSIFSDWLGWSDCQCGQDDDGIIADGGDGFQRHVAGALHGPFVVLLHQDGADETDDGVVVGEDVDDVGAALDLAVESFDRIGRADLGPMLLWEVHEGENVDLGFIEQGGEFRQLVRS